MSHVVSMEFPIDDLDCLEKACLELGLELRRGQETFKWYGRWVNDYNAEDAAYKLGIKPEDYGKCLHAIGVPGNSQAYEIGLIKRADGKPGYQMVYDFYSGGHGLMALAGKNCNKLCQQYSVHKTLKNGVALQQQGFVMKRHMDAQGKVHIVYSRA